MAGTAIAIITVWQLPYQIAPRKHRPLRQKRPNGRIHPTNLKSPCILTILGSAPIETRISRKNQAPHYPIPMLRAAKQKPKTIPHEIQFIRKYRTKSIGTLPRHHDLRR